MSSNPPAKRFRRPDNGRPASGAILYRGPSLIDGAPIVAVATFRSANRKTADMVQTWILPDPTGGRVVDSIRDGRDASVCGRCPHRPALGGNCYVEVGKAPNGIGKGVARGIYPDASNDSDALATVGTGRAVRLGAWGDPAAVPAHVWRAVVRDAKGWTGYTHQWRDAFADLRDLCMASVDSVAERDEAQAAGWRTFRVHADAESIEPTAGEITCPASAEAGARVTCDRCRLCGGTSVRAKSVRIRVH